MDAYYYYYGIKVPNRNFLCIICSSFQYIFMRVRMGQSLWSACHLMISSPLTLSDDWNYFLEDYGSSLPKLADLGWMQQQSEHMENVMSSTDKQFSPHLFGDLKKMVWSCQFLVIHICRDKIYFVGSHNVSINISFVTIYWILVSNFKGKTFCFILWISNHQSAKSLTYLVDKTCCLLCFFTHASSIALRHQRHQRRCSRSVTSEPGLSVGDRRLKFQKNNVCKRVNSGEISKTLGMWATECEFAHTAPL